MLLIIVICIMIMSLGVEVSDLLVDQNRKSINDFYKLECKKYLYHTNIDWSLKIIK